MPQQKKDFRVLGPKLNLFSHLKNQLVYLPNGEVLYWGLIDQWRQMHVKMEFQFIHAFAAIDPLTLHEFAFEKREGIPPFRFASLGPEDKELATIFCKKEKEASEMISSLQLLDKMIKIFGFKSEVSLTSPKMTATKDLFVQSLKTVGLVYREEEGFAEEGRVDFWLIDNSGMKTQGPFLALRERGEKELSLIYRSVFGSIERWIALMIETRK